MCSGRVPVGSSKTPAKGKIGKVLGNGGVVWLMKLTVSPRLQIRTHPSSPFVLEHCLMQRDRFSQNYASANDTAVHLQQLAIDETAFFRAKVSDHGGDVLGGAKPANGIFFE